ncbi:phytoene desaturase family protein [Lacibacter sp. MH-610]|uniref:1-hydroxycarotenoid 3,4-desaturase CrtD n=1 Tax=Lacibacter sp. MH-610 TaxID=3020883 RepID=UPI003891EAD7
MQRRKAIVIGSGVAGLASAVRLTVQGFETIVFERNSYAGGKLSLLEKDGFRFDAGPSLFTQPQNIERLFHDAGEDIHDYFHYESVPLSCRYFYDDGKVLDAATDAHVFDEALQTVMGEEKGALLHYLSKSEQLYQSIGTVFLNHSLHKRRTWLQPSIIKALKSVRFPYLFSTLHQYNKKHFSNPQTVQLFNRFATYNGSNPYQTPGMMSLIPHLELNEGTFYPKGGMISITNALYALAVKKGVRFYLNQPVDSIIHHQGRVKGIVAGTDNYFADVVVSNADVYFTYQQLLRDESKARKVLKQERSCSGVIFYWGMNKEFPQLHLHNIFFSGNYEAEFASIFQRKQLFHDPTVYVNITSKMEAEQAPAGKENWFVLINAPANTKQNWEQLKEELKQRVVQKLSTVLNEDVSAAIESEETLDPVTIESRTGSYLGALYGTSSNSKMAAFMRHPNFQSHIRGLYFCGGSVHPGGGIPLCFKSAEIVSNLVAQDFKRS